MGKRKKVAIIFGGRSLEHEVSVRSAINVMQAIDLNFFEIIPIGMSRKGKLFLIDLDKLYLIFSYNQRITVDDARDAFLYSIDFNELTDSIDIAFPVMHGKIGEDGSLQGLFETLNIPFAGSGVLSSSLCMDKSITKKVLSFEKILTPKFLTFKDYEKIDFDNIVETLSWPIFVKPCRSGSSVGINKAENLEELKRFIDQAFQIDHKILVEEAVVGLEVECAVLGNEQPIASLPGLIVSSHKFYDYEAKYIDPLGAHFEIPANLDRSIIKNIQKIAIKTYQALDCLGFARVDFLLGKDHQIYVNEVNTIPGFTNISLYPKMWEHSGISYTDLITKILTLGLENHQKSYTLLDNINDMKKEKEVVSQNLIN